MLKRLIDIIGAAALLAFTAPILAVSALAILIESGRPVLYLSMRIGRDHHPFRMWKLRSMVIDADPAVHREFIVSVLSGSGETSTATARLPGKLTADPRVTRVGRFLRRTSIDELPQLVNVIRGDMSLVGPRPDLPYSVEHYQPHHHRRFEVMPGMTGLWQVAGRTTVDVRRMLDLDVEYVDRWSLGLDVRILVRTVPSVLTKRGAGV